MIARRRAPRQPSWVDDLVIYEIATRSFTSPNGPESGTFRSLAERIPYLADLGVTGLWLTGYNLADNAHFYGIWTQYATVRPDALDPRLGTTGDFRGLVADAHKVGLRVFLDVTTHGVMSDSPLIAEHPDWFAGGSWGMTDYDWAGRHAELDRWWIDTWVRYAVEDGVDGYRLDVAMYRPDLWAEIKRRADAEGHPVVVFHELGPGTRGVVDFLQRDVILKDPRRPFDASDPRLANMHRTVRAAVENRAPAFIVEVDDEGPASGVASGDGAPAAARRRLEVVHVRQESRTGRHGVRRDAWLVDVAPVVNPAEVANITVTAAEHHTWMLRGNPAVDFAMTCRPRGRTLRLRLPMKSCPTDIVSVQLSCHDDGWEGFPAGVNPFAARGSRFVMGYAFLLAPVLPLFMSGEEMDADPEPLPRLTPGLFGGAGAGTGTWLYGNRLRWDQLEEPRHRDMLADVRDLLRFRRRYARLIRPMRRGQSLGRFHELGGTTGTDGVPGLPVPYAYSDGETVLVIAGNPSRERGARVQVEIPWAALGMRGARRVTIRDAWNDAESAPAPVEPPRHLTIEIPPDGRRKGGLAVWEIRRADPGDSR
jgi:hypothetical protein